MADFTRVDSALVKAVVASCTTFADGAANTLATVAPRLTKRQRMTSLKPPSKFSDKVRAMIEMAMEDAPELAAACKFDAEAVLEDLDNAEALIPLIARLEALLRTAQDARLKWRAEAYAGTLPLYRVAAVRAQDDAAVESVLKPLHEMFAHTPDAEEPAASAATESDEE